MFNVSVRACLARIAWQWTPKCTSVVRGHQCPLGSLSEMTAVYAFAWMRAASEEFLPFKPASENKIRKKIVQQEGTQTNSGLRSRERSSTIYFKDPYTDWPLKSWAWAKGKGNQFGDVYQQWKDMNNDPRWSKQNPSATKMKLHSASVHIIPLHSWLRCVTSWSAAFRAALSSSTSLSLQSHVHVAVQLWCTATITKTAPFLFICGFDFTDFWQWQINMLYCQKSCCTVKNPRIGVAMCRMTWTASRLLLPDQHRSSVSQDHGQQGAAGSAYRND